MNHYCNYCLDYDRFVQIDVGMDVVVADFDDRIEMMIIEAEIEFEIELEIEKIEINELKKKRRRKKKVIDFYIQMNRVMIMRM